MNFTKFVSAAITVGTLFGAAHAGAQVIDETMSGYVTAVETVWTQRIVHEPVTTTSCHCLLYTSPSPRDTDKSRMPSSA